MERVEASSQPMFSFKKSLLPPLVIDTSMVRTSLLEQVDTSTLETRLNKYLNRKHEIQSMRRLQGQKSQLRDEKLRKNKEEMSKIRQESQRKQEEKSQQEQKEYQRLCKAQEMMSACQNISDINTAFFYLEAENWDVAKAVQCYIESSGDSNIVGYAVPKADCSIKFILPNGSEFTQDFDGKQCMWSMLSKIYEKLPERRNFCVKPSRAAQPIKFEDMTRITFNDYGFGPTNTLIVEYIQ